MNLQESTLPKKQILKRKFIIRKKIVGTAERPRVSIYRSLNHIYAQVINDETGTTLTSCSTLSKDIKDKLKTKKKSEQAKIVGETLAKKMLALGIKKIVFDRNGRKYLGRIKTLADALRSGGIEF